MHHVVVDQNEPKDGFLFGTPHTTKYLNMALKQFARESYGLGDYSLRYVLAVSIAT